jgi:stage II sporulation protein D
MVSLLAMVIASAPLMVRVLEREHLHQVHLLGAQIACNDKQLNGISGVTVVAHGEKLTCGDQTCAKVRVKPDITLSTSAGLVRQLTGELEITAQKDELRFINTVDVETYLPGVLDSEFAGAPPAALAAQAVVSRTFALASRSRHRAEGYDLCDLAHCQVFAAKGPASAAAKIAVAQTSSLVLLKGSVALRPAFFHADCGGHTSTARDVFDERRRKLRCPIRTAPSPGN